MNEYTQKHDWDAVDEVKGWENPNMRDSLHKVTVVEHETGNEHEQTFNFTPDQTSTSRWKKHVDQWIDRMQNTEKTGVL